MNQLAKIEVLSKTDQQITAEEIIRRVIDGEVDPLKVEVYLKSLEETITRVRKNEQVRETILAEAEKYGKRFSVWGADVQLKSRKTWDYNPCDDSTLRDLEQQEVEIKEHIKRRKKILQSIDKEYQIADVYTGAVLSPPAYTEKPYWAISFKEGGDEQRNGNV